MALEDDIRTLGRTPLLDELGRDALRLIAFSADRLDLADGAVLFREGEDALGAFVVVSGFVRLTRSNGASRRVGEGALIGELALLCETRRPATAAAEGQATVYRIARTLFARLFDEYPDLARKLRARIAARVTTNAEDLKAIEAALRR
ncbi:cyclic nucleotide-binding domain-containing protein [Methylopila henanensis]|uniref:Cyclic nucleotide-binding domain-containing protein n=1 Tax=Methylopila henanensis TaxID=873516 RepID=A0ABW4K3H9_9HYPH